MFVKKISYHVADEYMMNVNLRPVPTRVNAILGCRYIMVPNGYCIPIFCFVNTWNRFQDTSRLQTKCGLAKLWGEGGFRWMFVAYGLM